MENIPWLDVRPDENLQAAEGGSNTGLGLARERTAAQNSALAIARSQEFDNFARARLDQQQQRTNLLASRLVRPPASLASVNAPQAAQPEDSIKDVIAATQAAQVYQAQRGYQSDLANGMSATDAMTKWGPLLFAGSRGSAAMMKPPPAAPRQQFHVAGRTPGSFDPATGKFTPIPGLAQTGTSESDRLIRKKYALDSSLRGELAKASPDPNKVANYRGMIEATQLEIARQNPGPPMAGTKAPPPSPPVRPPVAPPMAQGAKKPPVVRLTKDGKKALFDPDTKAFLGYAP